MLANLTHECHTTNESEQKHFCALFYLNLLSQADFFSTCQRYYDGTERCVSCRKKKHTKNQYFSCMFCLNSAENLALMAKVLCMLCIFPQIAFLFPISFVSGFFFHSLYSERKRPSRPFLAQFNRLLCLED
jgi:hypothetical protein